MFRGAPAQQVRRGPRRGALRPPHRPVFTFPAPRAPPPARPPPSRPPRAGGTRMHGCTGRARPRGGRGGGDAPGARACMASASVLRAGSSTRSLSSSRLAAFTSIAVIRPWRRRGARPGKQARAPGQRRKAGAEEGAPSSSTALSPHLPCPRPVPVHGGRGRRQRAANGAPHAARRAPGGAGPDRLRRARTARRRWRRRSSAGAPASSRAGAGPRGARRPRARAGASGTGRGRSSRPARARRWPRRCGGSRRSRRRSA